MAKPKKSKSSKWGKGKTDPDTWWKKGGPSPNPKGRPKGSKNQKTMWNEASAIKVEVSLDGKPAKMSKKEVKYHQLADKAANGDLKAMGMANELDARFDPVDLVPPSPEESAADHQALDEWIDLRDKFKAFAQPASAKEKAKPPATGGDDG